MDSPRLTRRQVLLCAGGAIISGRLSAVVAAGTVDISPQPYFAHVNRALEALAKLGAAAAPGDVEQIKALVHQNDAPAVEATEKLLDRYTLIRASLEGDGYTRCVAGGSERTLVEQGWRVFLLRVSNPIGYTGAVSATFGRGQVGNLSHGSFDQRPDLGITPINSPNLAPSIEAMWLTGELFDAPPLGPTLSGFALEYRVVQLFSRDRGRRRADIDVHTSKGAIPYASPWGVNLEFDCLPTHNVPLSVLDADGRGCMASLIIRDKVGRIYPPQAMRLAPDMPFQAQIYRGDGETVRLPDGEYAIESKRGPEYLRGIQTLTIGAGGSDRIDVRLRRWIDPAAYGWYSGDTHIHAAGCAHYNKPTEGVSPETLIRHVRGEALPIGDVLTWGPDYYYQKRFFTGHAESPAATLEHADLQVANSASWEPRTTPEDSESLIRYDLEISGFPSSHAGHLVLLRLKDQDYPQAKLIEDWPSWNLPILKWARAQGAVAGYAHGGCGMVVESAELPNYEIPRFDDCGTNEAIIDVTHDAVDFLSGCEMSPVAELNAWYHLLNCGFRLALLGETDWPCFFGDQPGTGRSYVRLDHRPVGNAGYDAWVHNLQRGMLYCGDGRSHFLRFTVNGRASGDDDIVIPTAQAIDIHATIAAWLEPDPTSETRAIQESRPLVPPCWHLERARIGETRHVAVELVVNGLAVASAILVADGKARSIKLQTTIVRSSWVALRILPSAHTHPVFVQVAGKPIRASQRSAEWCRACVDKLWEVKSAFMREGERPAAAAAFDHARKTYDQIGSECEAV
jgi:hypothetical protein